MKKLLSFILSLSLTLSLSISAFAAGPTFSDVPQNHWAYQFVEQAANEGWVAGVGDGKFNPNGKVTGAEWYTMVIRAFFADKIPGQTADGKWYSGKWYAQFMAADEQLVLAERLDDYATSQDIAERPLTRAEMAAVIFRALEWYDVQAPNYKIEEAEQSIPDLNDYPLEDGRRGPITKCYALGILTGTDSKGTFNGEADMTRAQAAVTLCRLADIIEAKENGTLPGPDYNPNPDPEPEPEPEPEPNPGDKPAAKVPTEAEAYDILMQIKKEYPTGTPWGDDKTWEDKNNWVKLLDGTIYYVKNSGCAAFTTMCKERIFGNYAENGLTERDHTDFDSIKVGDELRLYTSIRPGGTHSVIVVEKQTDSIVVAEGNFNDEVRWGRAFTRSELEEAGFEVSTVYPE